ncbi:MAG: tetratricopeptide repeat protein [Candidatus Solibacter usitatus]|nr:tetratricopeptide repeat protein [Candidatus Solibacter usitatus]
MALVTSMRVAPALLLPLLLSAGTTAGDLLRQAEERIQKEEFPSAEALLTEARRQEPGNVQALYRLGYVQYRQRKLSPARQSFAAAVKAAPPAYNSRYFLGRIALLENKPREAIEWLAPVVESKQVIFDAASQLAAAYAGAGQPQEALPLLKVAAADAPWDGSLYYRLGKLYSQLGQSELAQEAFDYSRRLHNASREDVETIMRAAEAIRAGKAAEALDLGARIQGRPDADPNALVALGVVYGGAAMAAEALRAFERAAKLDSGMFQAQFNQGLAALRLGRAAEALAPLARAVELLPQSFDANMTYGLACVMNQKYAEAVGPLEQAWRMDASNARVGALLATSYLRTGVPAKAIPVLRKASEAADPSPLLLLIEALNATEDTEGALEAARLAQKRFAKAPQAHLAAAQQFARLGRYQEARPAFEATLKLAPGQPEAELGLADTLQKAGEHSPAVEHYRAAINTPGTMPAARVGLARSLVALRRLEDARQILEDGLPLLPSDMPLHLELSRVYARLGKSDLAAEQTKIVEQLRAAQAGR